MCSISLLPFALSLSFTICVCAFVLDTQKEMPEAIVCQAKLIRYFTTANEFKDQIYHESYQMQLLPSSQYSR